MLDDPTAAPLLPPPAGFTLRRPSWRDLDAVADLYADHSLARTGQVTVRVADLHVRWLELEGFDDAVLVEHPDADPALVAYADVQADHAPWSGEVTVHVEGRVHPSWTGRGLAGFLLERAAARARRAAQRDDVDRAVLRTTVDDGNDAARAFFTARGFVPVRHLLELRLDLHAPPPVAVWPAGVTFRTFVPGRDEEALWRAHQGAFATHPAHQPLDLDAWLEATVRRDARFDPALFLLAVAAPDRTDPTDGETVIGFALCRAGAEGAAEDGWVRHLGVLPDWQGRGVGIALLRTAFAAFRARGLTGAALEVDDVTVEGAVRLYRRAGMRIVRRTDVVERSVSRGDDPG